MGEYAYVGNANGLGLATLYQLLHVLPDLDVAIVAEDVALAVGELGELVIVAYVLFVVSHSTTNFDPVPYYPEPKLTFRVHQKRPMLSPLTR